MSDGETFKAGQRCAQACSFRQLLWCKGCSIALQEGHWAAIQVEVASRGLGLELYFHNKGIAFIRFLVMMNQITPLKRDAFILMEYFLFTCPFFILVTASSQGMSWWEMGAPTVLPTECEMEERVGMGRELGMNCK